MLAVYVLAVAAFLLWWAFLVWGGAGRGSTSGESLDDGGIGGVDGKEAGEITSVRDRPVALLALAVVGVFGGVGILLRWVAPGLSAGAELALAFAGAFGFGVIAGAPGRKRSA